MDQSDDLKASLEAVIEVVAEMVEITEHRLIQENVCADKSEKVQVVLKEEPSSISENVNKDLPVRRSSRIQRLSVKKDEVTKKPVTKSNKTNKITTSSETNSISTIVPESDPSLCDDPNQTSLKTQPVLESENEKCKNHKVPKRIEPKISQKLEKENMKTTKLKNERKRTYRKKKQCSSDSENPNDFTGAKGPDSPGGSTDIHKDKVEVVIQNSAPENSETTVELFPDENKVPEVLNCGIKSSDNPVLDGKDESSVCSNLKPVKVKSRWWRSSELEGALNLEPTIDSANNATSQSSQDDSASCSVKMETDEDKVEDVSNNPLNVDIPLKDCNLEPVLERPVYEHIEENIYKFTRKKTKSKKQVRRMVCDCTLTKEEQEYGVLGCKEECLNRLLMIECGSRCPLGEACSNKKFQKKQYINADIFKTEKKGWGLKAFEDISNGDFLMEFVGEVLNHKEYRQRVKLYAKEKNVHCYFMALKTDEILDATFKGNFSRFINHSCDPNCETQKWTVNGELRVGVFAKRGISAGEEFTLDYKFQRYGREAQKCFCAADNCSGYIGGAKQISIDAYSGTKTTSSKKKKGSDDKKREWEDMILEEEIEKLNTGKGLRNREETLKLARLMVRADDSATRHQILDIIIKTEEQACLRLFLDYHGLPLLWSWMTDIVDLDLKAKILQVLALLPVTNKTMVLDSKVMNVVEKWVQEYDLNVKGESTESQDLSALPGSTDESSEPPAKKLKNIDFSDNETDSTDSHNAVDNSSENSSSLNENNDKSDIVPMQSETLPEPMQSEPVTEDKLTPTEDDPLVQLKANISYVGAELLKSWKNLKEVFRIPRLEQQKRKEDELEADHKVPELPKVEEPNPKIEVTGDHIQVLISGKTPARFPDKRTYHFDSLDIDYKVDDHPRKNRLPVLPNARLKRPLLAVKLSTDETSQRNIKEESDSSLDSASPLLSVTSPVQPSNRPALLPNPTLINQPPVNFPPPINTPLLSHPQMDQAPQTMYPPQMVYPPAQAPYIVTSGPPPVLPPTSMPPPVLPSTSMPPPTVFPQVAPMLTQPPPTANMPSCPPVNPGLPPNPANFQLPPNLPPPSTSQFIPNQVPGVPNYPPGPNPYSNPNQPFYFLQQPPTVPNSSAPTTFSENVCAPSSAVLPVPSANPMPLPSSQFPIQSSVSLPTQSANSVPMPSLNSIPIQSATSIPIKNTSCIPVIDQLPAQAASPVLKEEPKPVKLPKNWRSATDSEGNVYYYHSVTRETQWDPPTADQIDDSEDDDSDSDDSDSSDTPTYDEPKIATKHSKRKSKKRKATRPAADTTVSFPVRPETAKKIKELFRTKMSSYIVHCLNSYRKPDCKVGRITSNEDFKYLARKLTHYTMTKELKQCKNVEDLDCNDCVMHKARDFIKKYMSKYGSKYSRKEKFSPEP